MYLTNLAVEESYEADRKGFLKNTSNSCYSIKDIKMTPIGDLDLKSHSDISLDKWGSHLGVNISIPQLYEFVKTYGQSFLKICSVVNDS